MTLMVRGMPRERSKILSTASREEDLRGLAASDLDASGDVTGRFTQRQRIQCAAQRHALLQLTQRGFVQTVGQFRLSDENDRQQLLGVRFDVREQANLFEQLERDALRFVDDEHSTATLDELRLELVEQLRLGRGHFGRQAESRGEEFQELRSRESRILQIHPRRRPAGIGARA